MEEEKKILLFCPYFRHNSLCFYSNFDWESLLDVELNSTSNEYPHCILLIDPLPQIQEIHEKTWWWCHHQVFSGISCFWGSEALQKYVEWVLVGCKIKFCIQQALSIEIWVKTQGVMSKIQTKKVVYFMIPIHKFILKNCLRGAPFLNFKAFWLANTWWHGICIIFGRPILNWNFL